MPDAVEADAVVLGHRALGRLGSRVGLLYLASVGVAVAIGATSPAASAAGTTEPAAAMPALAVLLGCGLVLQGATRPGSPVAARGGAVAVTAAATAVVAALGVHLDWHGTTYAGSVTATGGAMALALAAGAGWGAAACLAALATQAAVLSAAGMPVGVVSASGAVISTAVSASIHHLLHRSFTDTERALAGADAAALAHQVSRERWRARRAVDRQLHDTVLSTLNLLTHKEFGTPDDVLRDLARRDRCLLEDDGAASPPPDADAVAATQEPQPTADDDAATALVRHWARSGLVVNLHGTSWDAAAGALAPAAERALLDATGQCLANVHAHAGVGEADVVVTREPGVVSVLVVDAGRGFDPAAVPADRLGIAESVRGRLAEVSGDVVLWSVPGEGTSVLLSVPGAPA